MQQDQSPTSQPNAYALPVARPHSAHSHQHWLAISLAIVTLLFLGISLIAMCWDTKWIGHFTLKVALQTTAEVDTTSIAYIECWSEADAKHYLNYPDSAEAFRQPTAVTPTTTVIDVTQSGTDRWFSYLNSHHEPAFLLIRYRITSQPHSESKQKLLRIPEGTNLRQTTLILP